MKNVFVKTKNVKNFVTLMDKLQKLPPNIPKLALVYGEHGLGKTHGDNVIELKKYSDAPIWSRYQADKYSEILQASKGYRGKRLQHH